MKQFFIEMMSDLVGSVNWGTMTGGAIGIVIGMFGGWTPLFKILLGTMALDYIAGILVAGMGHSKKSANGGIDSQVGFRGLLKKCLTLVMVACGAMVDRIVGTSMVRDAVIMFFSVNELISITENVGLCGIDLPKPLMNVLEQLHEDNNKEE